MTEQKSLIDLAIGEQLNMFLIVSRSQFKNARTGKTYLDLELRDKTAILPAKVWDRIDDLRDKIKDGIIVKIAGQVEEFNGMPQIRVEKIRAAVKSDNVDLEDFLPKSIIPLEIMIDDFNKIVDSVTNTFLKSLLRNIFSNNSFNKFSRAPAGKAWHHAYIHGLLEHTLEIIRICDLMCNIHPEVNRDLLICGALLHDFGKTDELTYETVFDYSDKGKFIGHIVLSAIEVEKAISSIPDFPEDLKNQLIHLILSHQGKLEFASPVEPKTLEAIVLYQADELSAKTNAYKSAIEADKNKSGNWTRFLTLANTSLYIPIENGNNNK